MQWYPKMGVGAGALGAKGQLRLGFSLGVKGVGSISASPHIGELKQQTLISPCWMLDV